MDDQVRMGELRRRADRAEEPDALRAVQPFRLGVSVDGQPLDVLHDEIGHAVRVVPPSRASRSRGALVSRASVAPRGSGAASPAKRVRGGRSSRRLSPRIPSRHDAPERPRPCRPSRAPRESRRRRIGRGASRLSFPRGPLPARRRPRSPRGNRHRSRGPREDRGALRRGRRRRRTPSRRTPRDPQAAARAPPRRGPSAGENA